MTLEAAGAAIAKVIKQIVVAQKEANAEGAEKIATEAITWEIANIETMEVVLKEATMIKIPKEEDQLVN